MSEFAVRMLRIDKSFNTNRVLSDVDFELRKGEIHALLGENGAGKSTLMKILQGVYTLDGGTIEVDGRPVKINSPQDARAAGIAMIFQEFSLVPSLTVAQNIFLGRELRGGGGLLDDREMERRTKRLFADMGVDMDPTRLVAGLSTGYRQLTEIAKALSQDTRVLILDEPTSSLAASETRALFQLIRRLKDRGISMIYISHRMAEIFEISDRITVLRDGRRVMTEEAANTNILQVIEQIVGRRVGSFEWRERHVDRGGVPLLEVVDLVSAPRVRGVSFRLYEGEILGLAGLMGSGRTETVEALFGIGRIDSGRVLVQGRRVDIRNSEDAMKSGIALIPEDRRSQGLVLGESIKNNLLLPILGRLDRAGMIDDRKGDQIVESFVRRLALRTDSIHKVVRLLSGGNQQKVVIGKWLATEPQILMMDEPTAGVDIQTKTEIVGMIRQLADSGKGIIVISSELPELLAVSDRILVLRAGVVDEELDRRQLEVPGGGATAGEARIASAEEILQREIQGV